MSAAPIVSIGQEGRSEYEFAGIVGAGKLASGSFAVFDRGANALRFYDSAGTHVRSRGRAGDGPGEFRDVHFMAVLGGANIYVYDQRLRRLTRWSPDGELLNTWTVFAPLNGSVLRAIGPAGDHTFVWSNFQMPVCADNIVSADTITYYRMTLPGRSGRMVDVAPDELEPFARGPGAHRWGTHLNILGACIPQNVPFAPGPLHAVRRGRFYIAELAGIRVVRHAFDLRTADSLRIEIARQPLAAATIDDYVTRALGAALRDEMGRSLSPNAGADLYARRLREVPYPDSLPAVDQFVVDDLDFLWLRMHPLPADSVSQWVVVAPDAARAQRLQLPARLRPVEIGESYILGIARDSLGIERMVVHALQR